MCYVLLSSFRAEVPGNVLTRSIAKICGGSLLCASTLRQESGEKGVPAVGSAGVDTCVRIGVAGNFKHF